LTTLGSRRHQRGLRRAGIVEDSACLGAVGGGAVRNLGGNGENSGVF